MPAAFTPKILHALAADREQLYEALLAKFPPGTVNDARNDARAEMERARVCAQWLERNGIGCAEHVGPFMSFRLRRGDTVRLRKGARVFGTGSAMPAGGRINTRLRIFEVYDFNPGYIDRHDDSSNPVIVQARVTWVGTGSYWRWTDIQNVELMAAQDAPA